MVIEQINQGELSRDIDRATIQKLNIVKSFVRWLFRNMVIKRLNIGVFTKSGSEFARLDRGQPFADLTWEISRYPQSVVRKTFGSRALLCPAQGSMHLRLDRHVGIVWCYKAVH